MQRSVFWAGWLFSFSLLAQAAVTDTIQISDFESSGITAAEAARFLNQASFGPTEEDIAQVQADGYRNWIRKQWALPQSSEYAFMQNLGLPQDQIYQNHRIQAWLTHATTGPDQLRQRVAWALSQIWVISDQHAEIDNRPLAAAQYYDMLASHASGNYRQLMEAVTTHPLMGHYLSMFQNRKPDPANGIRADENYAREIMQLFTIGLVELNPDGSVVTDGNGNPVPTYGQTDIENLARVFTGWTRNGWDVYTDGYCQYYEFIYDGDDTGLLPMEPCEAVNPNDADTYNFHDTDGKVLFTSVNFPAGQDARQDLAQALDVLFNHPNVGPFIGKQLIQHLVTSNPSPAYVQRVAAVFDDNGEGVRGDLAAVVEAILLDDEARNGPALLPNQFGKLREPLLRQIHLWRAFHAQPQRYAQFSDDEPERAFAQAPLRSPSVFNFYRPDFSPQGPVSTAGLLAPEFQILTASFATSTANRMWDLIMGQWVGQDNNAVNWQTGVVLNLSTEFALAADLNALLDHLDLLLMSGQMSAAMRTTLYNYLVTYPYSDSDPYWPDGARRTCEAIYLIMTSPEYAIQR